MSDKYRIEKVNGKQVLIDDDGVCQGTLSDIIGAYDKFCDMHNDLIEKESQLSAALESIAGIEKEIQSLPNGQIDDTNIYITDEWKQGISILYGGSKASIEAEAIRKAEPYVREMMAIDLGGVLLAKRMINDTIRAYNDYANNINKR